MNYSQCDINMQNLSDQQQQLVDKIGIKIAIFDQLQLQSDELQKNCQNKINTLKNQLKEILTKKQQAASKIQLEQILIEEQHLKKIRQKSRACKKLCLDYKQVQAHARFISSDDTKPGENMEFQQINKNLLKIQEEQNQFNKTLQTRVEFTIQKYDIENLNKQLKEQMIRSQETAVTEPILSVWKQDVTEMQREQSQSDQSHQRQSSQILSLDQKSIVQPLHTKNIQNNHSNHSSRHLLQHNFQHHYHHIQPPLIILRKDLIQPTPYLMSIYKMKQKLQTYYMNNSLTYCQYWHKQYNIKFNVEGWQLFFVDVVINMEEFLKQDWSNVQYIGFSGCKIDDIKWRMFADHAYLFPKLKWMSIKIKHIMTVKEGDLEGFNSLERVQFNYQQWTHPLTIPSKNYLKDFCKNHPNVQVVFG